MPRITRRHFLAASLGLPALLVTCGQPDEAALRTGTSAVPRVFTNSPTSGQGVRSTPSTVATPVAPEPVELWHFAWDDPIERRLWSAVRQQLGEDFPHIQLRQEFYDRPVEETVAISAAAGLPPEVASIQDMFFPRWVEHNLYVNIQTLVSDWLGNNGASDITPAAVNAFRYYPEAKQTGRGDYYGLPWRSNPRLLFLNEDIFRRNGLAGRISDERWTIEKVEEAAQQLTEVGTGDRLQVAGIGFPDSWFQSLPWLWSGGGDIFDDTGKVSTVASPAAESVLRRLQAWRHTMHFAPRVGELGADTYVQNFATQRLAMFLGSANDMYRLRATDVAWQARALHPNEDGESQTFAAYDGLAIVTGSQQFDTAWEFLRWALRPEVQALVIDSEYALPVLPQVIAAGHVEPHYSAALLEETDAQRSLPIGVTYPLYSPVIAHHYHMMMNGGYAPVPETLRTLHSLLTFILERQDLPSQWQ